MNQSVFQNGGVMTIFSDAPSSFHTPSLFEAFTLKVYPPGLRFVYDALFSLPTKFQAVSSPSSR